jgi:hypothetical protein
LIPTYYEVYEEWAGKKFAGPQAMATLALIRVGFAANKSFHLPKGADSGALKARRNAIRATFKDKSFLKKKGKVLGNYPVAIGEPAKKALHQAISLNAGERKWIKDYFKKQFNLDLII